MNIDQERQRLEEVSDSWSQDGLHDIDDPALLGSYDISMPKLVVELLKQIEDEVGAQEKLWDGQKEEGQESELVPLLSLVPRVHNCLIDEDPDYDVPHGQEEALDAKEDIDLHLISILVIYWRWVAVYIH